MRSETYLQSIVICAAIVLFNSGFARAGTWTNLDYPGASETSAFGISGNKVVGGYYQSASNHWRGFVHDGATWATLDAPGAIEQTVATGISGNNIVGYYQDGPLGWHGFIYDETTWTTLNYSNQDTWVYDVDGSNIVGTYGPGSKTHGFIYDSTTWTTLDFPGANVTELRGVSGDYIVGFYNIINNPYQGFLYNMATDTWTTLDAAPDATTFIYGISGNNIVGRYISSSQGDHGFLYNLTDATWTNIDYPGATATSIYGISGNELVGEWGDGYHSHGFIYTIPEPATLLLLGLGSVILRRKR